jgi:hypothetical protein
VLKDLIIAPRVMQQVEEDETSRKIVQLDKFFDKAAAPLRVTAMDEKKSIAIEFVCEKNYSKLGGVCRGDVFVVDRDGHISASITRSVTNFDYKDAAQYTATEIRQKARQRLYVGVLYDPLTRVTSVPRAESSKTRGNRRSARDKATAESKELLRRQAQDFVAWLKRQGAI